VQTFAIKREPATDCTLLVNFERLDDAVRARKALNGRDVLGPDVGAIRIGYARVPTKTNGTEAGGEDLAVGVQGVGDLTVGATIHALRTVKGATTIPADQQVLGGAVENYRSNLLLSMIGSGNHNISDGQPRPSGWTPSVTEQQMIMRELSAGVTDAEADIQALAGTPVNISRLMNGTDTSIRLPSSDDVLHEHPVRSGASSSESTLGRSEAS